MVGITIGAELMGKDGEGNIRGQGLQDRDTAWQTAAI